MRNKGGYISIADGVFASQSLVVGVNCFLRNVVFRFYLRRRNNIELLYKFVPFFELQSNFIKVSFSCRYDFQCHFSVFRCPNREIAQAGGNGSFAIFIGLRGEDGIKFGIVVNTEFHVCVGNRCFCRIHHPDSGFGCIHIV